MKSVRKTTSIKNLVVDFDLNIRNRDNYDLPNIKDQIIALGRIVKTILVKAHPTEPGKFIVLSGNRRTLGGQELYADPTISVELKEALDKVEILVFSEMSAQEELSVIIDHGGEKPISRSEIVQAVWRLDKSFMSEQQIINQLYFALAKYSGNEKRLAEVPKQEPARSKFLKTWLHGTVGNFILYASRLGDYVREQFLRQHLAEDKLLPDGVTVEFKPNRDNIQLLNKAKNDDVQTAKKDGRPESEGWSWEKGGKTFNETLEKLKADHANGVKPEKKERPSVKDLEERANQFKSTAVRKALLIAAGDVSQGRDLAEEDERLYYLNMKVEILAKYAKDITDPLVRELIGSILHGAPGGVELAIRPFLKS